MNKAGNKARTSVTYDSSLMAMFQQQTENAAVKPKKAASQKANDSNSKDAQEKQRRQRQRDKDERHQQQQQQQQRHVEQPGFDGTIPVCSKQQEDAAHDGAEEVARIARALVSTLCKITESIPFYRTCVLRLCVRPWFG